MRLSSGRAQAQSDRPVAVCSGQTPQNPRRARHPGVHAQVLQQRLAPTRRVSQSACRPTCRRRAGRTRAQHQPAAACLPFERELVGHDPCRALPAVPLIQRTITAQRPRLGRDPEQPEPQRRTLVGACGHCIKSACVSRAWGLLRARARTRTTAGEGG